MAKERIKVSNPGKSLVLINLKNYNGKQLPVKAHQYIMLTEDELAYVMNTSRVFELGILVVQDVEKLSDDIDTTILVDNPNIMTEDDINKFLKKSQKVLKEGLEDIENEELLRDILQKAKDINKPVKTIELIEKRLQQLIEE